MNIQLGICSFTHEAVTCKIIMENEAQFQEVLEKLRENVTDLFETCEAYPVSEMNINGVKCFAHMTEDDELVLSIEFGKHDAWGEIQEDPFVREEETKKALIEAMWFKFVPHLRIFI